MAPPRKSLELRQDNRASRMPALTAGVVEVPEPNPEWTIATLNAWDDLWDSELATVLDANAVHIARRLFDMRNERDYLLTLYRAEPMVSGSTGQQKMNPAFSEAQKLEAGIVALEDRLGISPRAKASLGIAIGQYAITVEELNKRARERAEHRMNADHQDSEGYRPFVRG